MIVMIGARTELWQGSISLHPSYGLSHLAEEVVILIPCACRSIAFVSSSVSSGFVEHYPIFGIVAVHVAMLLLLGACLKSATHHKLCWIQIYIFQRCVSIVHQCLIWIFGFDQQMLHCLHCSFYFTICLWVLRT